MAATKRHPAELVIVVVAHGSRITKLIDVHLRRCQWNLGAARNQHFKGGRDKVRIKVARRKPHVAGQITFTAVDAAGQSRSITLQV